MKKALCLAFLLLFVGNVQAQQNLFNIPSGDINPGHQVFYQHQFNFYNIDELESKSHIVYGLGRGWDTGLNLVDLPVNLGAGPTFSHNDSSNRKPLYPMLMGSLQKQWVVASHAVINVGTQVGTNLTNQAGTMDLGYFNFGIIRYIPDEHVHLLTGLYHTNDVYVGGPESQHVGFMLGYEYKISRQVVLMGDFVSGDHKKSVTVLGGGYTVSDRLQLFLGALLAFPNEELPNGVVMELNWFGWDFMEE
ncbi:MAG: hypothetical protein JNN04_14425 [Cyclobacteriaceae bacterium]|nr:hypothetical protein [Cyclobacteriaceae bacterium]